MTQAKRRNRQLATSHYEVNELALSLAEAERALRLFTADQVDAIVGADGKAYLLRPAQEHLRENEKRLGAVLESVANAIAVVDRSGTVVCQNRHVGRVLGYEPEGTIGTNIFELIRKEDLPDVHSAFINVAEGFQTHATAQFNHRSRDGSYRMVEATMGKLRGTAATNIVLSLRPIAHPARERIEFTRREEEAAQAAPSKDRFLAMLAHELRTPIMPVLLGITEMQEDGLYPEVKPILEMMRRNIDLQMRLLDELTDFIRIGQHKVLLRPERIDIHDTVRFVLEICRGEIAAARIDVVLNLKATGSCVVADSLRLQQILWNLVRNAIKFSPQGGCITIASVNETRTSVTIEVFDNGIGIEAEMLPLVFDPFKQGEHAKTQKGLGLGMFIARGLAEAHDGSLTVSSDGPGLGATFRLTLNLAPAGSLEQSSLQLFNVDA